MVGLAGCIGGIRSEPDLNPSLLWVEVCRSDLICGFHEYFKLHQKMVPRMIEEETDAEESRRRTTDQY